MSADEDTELRDLIMHTLENNGIIGKMKAELRASVFLALEDEGSTFKDRIPLVNKRLTDFISTSDGLKIASLVREFLQYFNLNFTLTVFDPEVSVPSAFLTREELARQLKFNLTEEPLITQLFKARRNETDLEFEGVFGKGAAKAKLSAKATVATDTEEDYGASSFKASSISNEGGAYDPFYSDDPPTTYDSGPSNFALESTLFSKEASTFGKLSLQGKASHSTTQLETSEQKEKSFLRKDSATEHFSQKAESINSINLTSLKDAPALNTKALSSDWPKRLPRARPDLSFDKGLGELKPSNRNFDKGLGELKPSSRNYDKALGESKPSERNFDLLSLYNDELGKKAHESFDSEKHNSAPKDMKFQAVTSKETEQSNSGVKTDEPHSDIEENIEELVEEDLDDLLSSYSNNSTSDSTISQQGKLKCDYVERVN